MYKKVTIDKRHMPVPCRKGCGGEFMPAGRAHHEKFCTGPGYVSSGTHSVPGSHAKKQKKSKEDVLYCQYCHKPIGRQGIGPHEKFCKARPDYREQRAEHAAKFKKPEAESNVKFKVGAYEYRYVPKQGVEVAFNLFKDDAALFSALCSMINAHAGTNVIENLRDAKEMIEFKIKSLEE